MKDNELQFDRSCHVLYSKPCKKEILAKIALHYPAAEREAVWEQVQRQYVDFLTDWRTDLGGKKNFHNGAGGTYDCIAILSYYVACRAVTSFREIEAMEENLILPAFRRLKFVDCNKPFFKKLMYKAFTRAKSLCDQWRDYEMAVSPFDKDKPIYYEFTACPAAEFAIKHGLTDNDLRERLQMRLHHLRRQGPLSARPPRIPRRGGLPAEPVSSRPERSGRLRLCFGGESGIMKLIRIWNDTNFQLARAYMTIEIKETLTGSILDIGGGGEAVIGQIYKDRVTAIDNCEEELEEAPDCCSKQLMDATELLFPDDSFDNVTFFYTLMYMTTEEQQKSIREAARVLKAGKWMHIWDCDIRSAYPEPFVIDLDIKSGTLKIHTAYGIVKRDAQSSDSIVHLLENAGLRIESLQEKDGQFHIQCRKDKINSG